MINTRRKGMAIPLILGISMALIIFVGVMFFNTRQQRGTHERLENQTKALMAARTAMQLAKYKLRVLPREFFTIGNRQFKATQPAIATAAMLVWLADLRTDGPDFPLNPAKKIRGSFPESGEYRFGIDRFELLSQREEGYKQDYVAITTWGSYKGERKILDELIEVAIINEEGAGS